MAVRASEPPDINAAGPRIRSAGVQGNGPLAKTHLRPLAIASAGRLNAVVRAYPRRWLGVRRLLLWHATL
jgi:hypothetical protein